MYYIYCFEKKPEGFMKRIKVNSGKEFYVPLESLVGFNKINIFIGGNNSGKSRLLRNMFMNTKGFLNFNEEFEEWVYRKEGGFSEIIKNFYRIRRDELIDYNEKINDFFDKYYYNKTG